MLTLVYKCLVNIEPFDLTSSSHVRISKYNLRGGGGGAEAHCAEGASGNF